MNKSSKSILLVFTAILMVIIPLSGCRKAGDKLNEKIAEGITEKYLEGITGGNADLDIEEGKWPKDMPSDVPEFNKGKIENSSSITVSGQTQLSVIINDVQEKDYNDYVEKLQGAGFATVMASNYDGILSGSYMRGDKYMTLTLDIDTKELVISYAGKE